MALIRLVHPRDYNPDLKRFTSFAYKNLRGGMSVFLEECAEDKSASVCQHATTWYPSIAGDPVIFYRITAEEVPAGTTLAETPAASGDDCHRDIQGASDAALKRAFTGKNWDEYLVCEDGIHRPLTQADIDAFPQCKGT